MNNQKENGNDMDIVLVEYNNNTQPSEATGVYWKRKTSPEESETQYHFQGQSTISQHWFDLDHLWIEDNFMTRGDGFQNTIPWMYYMSNK